MKEAILPIIHSLCQLLVGDPGVLNRVGCVGVAKLSLNRRDIAGFLDEVPAHGVAGVMGRVTLDTGQTAHFIEHRIDHLGVETTATVCVGGRRKKQRRRFPFLKKRSCPVSSL